MPQHGVPCSDTGSVLQPRSGTTSVSTRPGIRVGFGAARGRTAPCTTPALQLKLALGQPGDPYEMEADRVADRVTSTPKPQLQRQDGWFRPYTSRGTKRDRLARLEAGDKPAANGAGAGPEMDGDKALSVARTGQKRALPFKAELEAELKVPLDNVEAFFGPPAVRACQMVGARAFTVLNTVVFAEETPGKNTVRHEVAHVLQQGGERHSLPGSPEPSARTSPEVPADQEAAGVEPGSTAKGTSPDNEGTATRQSGTRAYVKGDKVGQPVLARLPAPPSFGFYKPGLSKIAPIIKEGYDGSGSVTVNDWDGWCNTSWRRRWTVYDATDKLVYDSSYTWPQPTLYFDQSVISKGKAGGKNKPWSVWIEVTHTLEPFGGSDPNNFPYAYKTFEVYQTWGELMADPNAKLSDRPSGGGQGGPVQSPAAKGGSSVVDYGSVTAMHEAYLRSIYDSGAKSITETASKLVEDGVVSQKEAGKWAVDARNGLKAKIRNEGNPILKKVFEQRNLSKYGNKLGPSYEQLYAKYAKQGLSPKEINAKIIGSAGKSNIAFNRWSGRLKWGGRVLLAIDICLAGVRVWLAPEGEKLRTALSEAFRIGGALALGAAGAKGGAALGAAIGALFGGAGAVPGAIIGGIIGGIGGALFGGWLGESAIEQLYKLLPPDGVEFDGEFEEGLKERQ